MIKNKKFLITLIAPFLISANVLAMDSKNTLELIDIYKNDLDLKKISIEEDITEEEKNELEELKDFNRFNKLINKGITGSISFQKFMAKDEVDKRFEKEQKYDSKLKKIHIAAEIGAEEYLEELLKENPEDIEAVDENGLTPLMRSTMDLTCKSAKLLISKGANLQVKDKYNNDLYILANALENEVMIEILLDNEAPMSLDLFENVLDDSDYENTNIDEYDKKIFHAVRINCSEYFEKNWSSIKDRVNNGVKVPAKLMEDEENGDAIVKPLLSACDHKLHIVKTLVKLGADVNIQGTYTGVTGLHCAVQKNNLEIVKLLLNANARIEIANFKGETPLALAIELRKKLEEKGDQEELKKNEAIINMLKNSSIDKLEQN